MMLIEETRFKGDIYHSSVYYNGRFNIRPIKVSNLNITYTYVERTCVSLCKMKFNKLHIRLFKTNWFNYFLTNYIYKWKCENRQ